MTFGRQIGEWTPIIKLIDGTAFVKRETSTAESTPFFGQFKEMYNGLPVFCNYSSYNNAVVKRCFEWLDSALVNLVIYSLLHNDSLKEITNIDGERGFTTTTEFYSNIENFKKIQFIQVSPYTLDGELTELTLQGSVYCNWPYPASETKLLALDFVNSIMNGRYHDFKVYRTHENWGGYTLGYFISYFLFDTQNGEFWILSKDDYD